MKSRLLLQVVFVGMVSANYVQAINWQALVTSAVVMSASTDAQTYRIHNLDHRTIDLACKCGKSNCGQSIEPTKHAKIECAISSLSASVVSESGVNDDVSIYSGSPTDKTVTKYRTFGVTVGDCPSKHHLCGRAGKDKTTIFSRYFPNQETNSTYSVGFYDLAAQSTEYTDSATHNLRGLKK